jgi:hypothetical protein
VLKYIAEPAPFDSSDPRGHCENTRVVGKDLLQTAVFDDTTEFDREISTKYEKGVLRAFSVGFAPGEAEVRIINGEEIIVYSKNELRETSAVNVPSNPNALAKRNVETTIRAMARAAGGRVLMRDVYAHIRATAAVQERIADAATTSDASADRGQPATNIPQTQPREETPTRGHGDTPMKKSVEIQERDMRADKGGMTCSVACPSCKEDFDMSVRVVPMSPEKAAELDNLRTANTAQERAITEQKALVLAEQNRAAALEGKLAEANTRLTAHWLDTATREIEQRIGKKIEPHERDDEVGLARMFLADTSPDPESPKDANGIPTGTMGQRKCAARLVSLDKRRDLGLLGTALTTGAALPVADPQVRAAVDGTAPAASAQTRGGESLADLLDASPVTAA